MFCPKFLYASGIYAIRNLKNGKIYVGSAVRLSRRWWTHRSDLRKGNHHSSKLQRSWAKHGEENFSFEVLLYAGRDDLIFYEQRAIDTLKPDYNICLTAGSCLGVKHTARQAELIRAAHLGSKRSAESRARMSQAQKALGRTGIDRALRQYWSRPENSKAGKPLPEHHRLAIKRGSQKKVLMPEHLEKLEAARRRKATLSYDQVREIRRLSRNGMKRPAISKLTGASVSCIGDILRGDTYRYVED